MWRVFIAVIGMAIAACAQIPPSPEQIEAQKLQAVPGKSVVYIVQDSFRDYNAGLELDDGTQINTWPGTFYRWVTVPGTHTIRSSDGNLSASIVLQLDAGKIYFVQHTVNGIRGSTTEAGLHKIDDRTGRRLVARSTLCCAEN